MTPEVTLTPAATVADALEAACGRIGKHCGIGSSLPFLLREDSLDDPRQR